MRLAGILLAIFLIAYFLNSCTFRKAKESSQVKNITVQELKDKINAGEKFILLDVREKDEYAAGNISGSRLIPLGEIEQRSGELDKNQEIVVYCRSGRRSLIGANKLGQLGFTKVTNVLGGFSEWQRLNK